jgi:cyclophilin family peptidyl-prolyl cis-trans isomerase
VNLLVHLILQIMHTTLGDLHVRLYPEECPRTVENFTTHCRNGYYDNLIFHRVIKGFMIQTGDPLGDGTGGQSIWGGEFEDEFHKRCFQNLTVPLPHVFFFQEVTIHIHWINCMASIKSAPNGLGNFSCKYLT